MMEHRQQARQNADTLAKVWPDGLGSRAPVHCPPVVLMTARSLAPAGRSSPRSRRCGCRCTGPRTTTTKCAAPTRPCARCAVPPRALTDRLCAALACSRRSIQVQSKAAQTVCDAQQAAAELHIKLEQAYAENRVRPSPRPSPPPRERIELRPAAPAARRRCTASWRSARSATRTSSMRSRFGKSEQPVHYLVCKIIMITALSTQCPR